MDFVFYDRRCKKELESIRVGPNLMEVFNKETTILELKPESFTYKSGEEKGVIMDVYRLSKIRTLLITEISKVLIGISESHYLDSSEENRAVSKDDLQKIDNIRTLSKFLYTVNSRRYTFFTFG